MNVPHRKPWWKRKRWITAALLWSAVAYELSFGPAFYCVRRGWIPVRLLFAFFPDVIPDPVGEAIGLWDYNRWWDDLARSHAGLPPARR